MNAYTFQQLPPLLAPHGRVWQDGDARALWFNWTCSGFTITFTGTTLRAKILALGDGSEAEGLVTYPVVGVAREDGALAQRFRCTGGPLWYTLFQGEEGTHTLRIVKVSENQFGKTGLQALETDGELLPARAPRRDFSVEFIGDSITCGFGNEAPHRDAEFDTAQENGWETWASLAARELNAEYDMVCVSGISTARAKFPQDDFLQMEELYPYADRLGARRLEREPLPWDFAAHPKDVIVVNLGTNDVNPIRFNGDRDAADQEEAWFTQRYRAFIETLRRLNGPATQIFCTLGPLDYYLYDHIQEAVEAYRRDTGDEKVACFKLIGVNLNTEGWGAISHPSMMTHRRLGREVAARLRAFGWGNS